MIIGMFLHRWASAHRYRRVLYAVNDVKGVINFEVQVLMLSIMHVSYLNTCNMHAIGYLKGRNVCTPLAAGLWMSHRLRKRIFV
jgi:hypothetical protein